MGVFARLFRRSKTTEETRAAETRTDPAPTGPEADDAAGSAEPQGSAEARETAEATAKEADEVGSGESVDIPKQQSSESAGSEAGEGART